MTCAAYGQPFGYALDYAESITDFNISTKKSLLRKDIILQEI